MFVENETKKKMPNCNTERVHRDAFYFVSFSTQLNLFVTGNGVSQNSGEIFVKLVDFLQNSRWTRNDTSKLTVNRVGHCLTVGSM